LDLSSGLNPERNEKLHTGAEERNADGEISSFHAISSDAVVDGCAETAHPA